MAGDILGIGVSGLLAYQRSLATAGHNITNANTEGYSRQRVDLGTRPPDFSGAGYNGTGVNVESVRRVYDSFLTSQVRTSTASFNQSDYFHTLSSRIDNLLADPQAGLTPALQSFFNSVQGVSNDPSSVAARQVLLSEASSLVERFKSLDSRLSDINSSINIDITNTVSEINSIAQGIASANQDIALAAGSGAGVFPNDLLDKRDALIVDLSKRIAVTTVPQDDGSINIFIGNGQSLVTGFRAQTLNSVQNQFDPTRLDVGYKIGNTSVNITDQLSGGKLGGVLDFRKNNLDEAKKFLGRVAIGLADTFNDQHKLGQDLNGQLGGDFFKVPAIQVQSRVLNSGTGLVAASLVNPGAITTSEYRLTYNGANAYTLQRLSDSQTFAINTGGTTPYTTEEFDGFSINITAGSAVNDSFLIKPTYTAAQNIGLTITDAKAIAAASPIRTSAALANAGTGIINPGVVNSPNNRVSLQFTSATTYNVVDETTGASLATSQTFTSGSNIPFNGWTIQISGIVAAGDKFYVDKTVTTAATANIGAGAISPAIVSQPDPNLRDPVTITFNSPPITFNVTGAATGSPVTTVPYVSGQPISFNGWTVKVTGTPAAGDVFKVGANTNGVSDNRNALLLTQLQTQHTLDNGTATYQDAYGQLVAKVGTQTRQAEITSNAQEVLKNQAIESRDSLSGVNLDEEAADLVRLQQAYQAAAQVISVSDTLFQALLGAVRR